MIQSVISRMASNSFLLKGWTVTLVVGLLAFANIKDMDFMFMFLAVIPIGFFWLLDGYFICQGRLYVKLYEHVITLQNDQIDFSLDANPFEEEAGGLEKAICSNTLLLFYLPILTVVIISIFFFK